ncbi:MAG: hypothetical protein JRM97_07875 [Nitrososphaerota archaeon]|jgi:hypothetical protein|nr:hypothetical protein [Nitrososphaerota archaeon]MDG7017236.1 hypothetical protein [Nitrososphaerota archaeon]MDG7019418.1 hypothetical protein [Nitrososphaerota archaeon]MDG7032529.1 hypothetical protein [Nitrososphaerota archaeon]MDG7034550.1 hypothetical protein [Nitrososphaerota archaeon]
MKTRTPRGAWALRGVSVAVALAVILVVGTVAYSAYQDYTAVKAELGSGPGGAVGSATLQGSAEVVSINITIPNKGLYTLNVTVSCALTPGVTCQPAQVSVPPGGEGVLHFRMTVANLSQFLAVPGQRVDGTVAIGLVPFAGLTIGVDLGSFVKAPGAP